MTGKENIPAEGQGSAAGQEEGSLQPPSITKPHGPRGLLVSSSALSILLTLHALGDMHGCETG